jgi:hypothetical protein
MSQLVTGLVLALVLTDCLARCSAALAAVKTAATMIRVTTCDILMNCAASG